MPKAQPTFTTIGERLRWAIDRRPADGRKRGLKLFQRDIEERSRARERDGMPKIEGASLPSIMSYLPSASRQKAVVPGVAFLEAAADLCGVRVSWLTYGDGFPTDAHEAAAHLQKSVVGADEAKTADALRMAKALLRAMGHEPTDVEPDGVTSHFEASDLWGNPTKAMLPHWLTTVAEVRLRLIMSGAYNDANPLGGTGARAARWVHERVERDIARALVAPLQAFALRGEQLTARELDDYVALLLPALLHLTNVIARVGHDAMQLDAIAEEATDTPKPKKSTRARKNARTK